MRPLLAWPDSPASPELPLKIAAGKSALPVLAGLCLLVVALHLASISGQLRLACFDDEAVFAALADPARYEGNLLLDFSLGRFYGQWKFWFLSQLLALPSAWSLGVVRAACLLLPALACGWWLGRALRSAVAGPLVSALWLATFAVFPGYQPFLSNPLLLLGLSLIFVAAGCVLETDRPGSFPLWRMLAILCFSAALVMHEVFLPFLAVIVWSKLLFGPSSIRLKSWGAFLAPYVAVAGAYVLIYFALKKQGAALGWSYDGTELRLRPAVITHALLRYTVSALPGFEIVFTRAIGAAHFYGPAEIFQRIVLHLRWQDVAVALLVGFVVAKLAARLSRTSAPRLSLAAACLTASLIFLPSLLIALTPKYQEMARRLWPPYYYGGLGLPFFWLLVGLGLWRLLAAARQRNDFTARCMVALIALGVAFAHGATSAINREAVQRLLLEPFR